MHIEILSALVHDGCGATECIWYNVKNEIIYTVMWMKTMTTPSQRFFDASLYYGLEMHNDVEILDHDVLVGMG